MCADEEASDELGANVSSLSTLRASAELNRAEGDSPLPPKRGLSARVCCSEHRSADLPATLRLQVVTRYSRTWRSPRKFLLRRLRFLNAQANRGRVPDVRRSPDGRRVLTDAAHPDATADRRL